ncbi:hypothetical protein QUF75_19430 [Desulfococcaceae bacterium HSG7]|nr:hypothetical protein [Desulfococcaceae bacterium HSG9]MDM8556904.1 hypothetical protein [Desulfococcaceae bacterium HSG7]
MDGMSGIGICRPYMGLSGHKGIRILQICRSYGAENRHAVRNFSNTFRSTEYQHVGRVSEA